MLPSVNRAVGGPLFHDQKLHWSEDEEFDEDCDEAFITEFRKGVDELIEAEVRKMISDGLIDPQPCGGRFTEDGEAAFREAEAALERVFAEERAAMASAAR